MDDNLSHSIIPISWNTLWDRLSLPLIIRYGIDVTDIVKSDNLVIIRSFQELFYARNLIIATDIITLRRLLPTYPIYNYIEGQLL